MTEHRSRRGVSAGKRDGLLALRDCFFIPRFLFRDQCQVPVGIDKVLIHFERFLDLVHRLVIPTRQVKQQSQIRADSERERIEFVRSSHLCDGFI